MALVVPYIVASAQGRWHVRPRAGSRATGASTFFVAPANDVSIEAVPGWRCQSQVSRIFHGELLLGLWDGYVLFLYGARVQGVCCLLRFATCRGPVWPRIGIVFRAVLDTRPTEAGLCREWRPLFFRPGARQAPDDSGRTRELHSSGSSRGSCFFSVPTAVFGPLWFKTAFRHPYLHIAIEALEAVWLRDGFFFERPTNQGI